MSNETVIEEVINIWCFLVATDPAFISASPLWVRQCVNSL